MLELPALLVVFYLRPPRRLPRSFARLRGGHGIRYHLGCGDASCARLGSGSGNACIGSARACIGGTGNGSGDNCRSLNYSCGHGAGSTGHASGGNHFLNHDLANRRFARKLGVGGNADALRKLAILSCNLLIGNLHRSHRGLDRAAMPAIEHRLQARVDRLLGTMPAALFAAAIIQTRLFFAELLHNAVFEPIVFERSLHVGGHELFGELEHHRHARRVAVRALGGLQERAQQQIHDLGQHQNRRYERYHGEDGGQRLGNRQHAQYAAHGHGQPCAYDNQPDDSPISPDRGHLENRRLLHVVVSHYHQLGALGSAGHALRHIPRNHVLALELGYYRSQEVGSVVRHVAQHHARNAQHQPHDAHARHQKADQPGHHDQRHIHAAADSQISRASEPVDICFEAQTV